MNENVTYTDDKNLDSVVQSYNGNTDDEGLNYTIQLDNDEISVSKNGYINNIDLENIMEMFIFHTDYDITLETTEDNIRNEQIFIK